MTERKKEYIIDALGEIEDAYIAEAAEYQKPARRWKYWRECSAVAACVGAVVITAAAWQYLPIGRSESAQNTTAEKEMWTGEAAPESTPVKNSGGVTVESTTAAESIKEEPEYAMEGAEEEITQAVEGSGAEGGQSAEGAVEEHKTSAESGQELQDVFRSENISWETVYDSREQGGNIAEIGSSPNQSVGQGIEAPEGSSEQQNEKEQSSIKTESISQYRSAEEILAEGRDIFLGTVTEKQILRLTEGLYNYFTVITVTVESSIRGDMEAGEECKIYLPVAVTDRLLQDNSLSGDLTELAVGSRAIFMPKTAKDGDGIGSEGAWLAYKDFADYYFTEGLRYLFLEQKDKVSFAEDVYEVPAGATGSVTLEDVEAYLKEMLRWQDKAHGPCKQIIANLA